MLKLQSKSKSPLTLLLVISLLVISTCVMISNYFLRPGLESDLKNRVVTTLSSHNITNVVINVEGRGVVLNGIADNLLEVKKVGSEVQKISGISHVKNKLVVGIKKNSH